MMILYHPTESLVTTGTRISHKEADTKKCIMLHLYVFWRSLILWVAMLISETVMQPGKALRGKKVAVKVDARPMKAAKCKKATIRITKKARKAARCKEAVVEKVKAAKKDAKLKKLDVEIAMKVK